MTQTATDEGLLGRKAVWAGPVNTGMESWAVERFPASATVWGGSTSASPSIHLRESA